MAQENKLVHRSGHEIGNRHSIIRARSRWNKPVQFVTDNILLFAIAFASGGMLLWPLVRARTAGPSVTTLEATRLINSKNAQIVDVRAANDFASGSLPNAKNIPSANLKDRLGELKKERPVILVGSAG